MLNLRAAICRIGHVVSRDAEADPPPRRCPACGVNVFTECLDCGEPFRGPAFSLVPDANGLPRRAFAVGGYVPPWTCHKCGEPHPWAFGARKSS